jgi:hypothetical protein
MKNGTLVQWANGVGKPYTGNRSTTGNGNQGIRITGSGWYNDNYLAGDIRFTGTYTYSWAEDADSVTYS